MPASKDSFLYARGDKRLFPYKDVSGKVDAALVQVALTDIGHSDLPLPTKAYLMTKAKAIYNRTMEAELHSYIRLSEPKESDMASDIFNRISESVASVVQKQLWLEQLKIASARLHLSAVPVREPAAPDEEKPVAEAMQESYMLPAEALSEVASWEQGDERVIRNCTFIKAGLNAPKTRRWEASLLEGGLDCFDGSLCYIDHPADGKPRSLRALAGHTRNPHFDKATDSVVGDIVLLANNEAADYVVSVFGNDTVRDSGAVGLSVIWEGGTFERDFEEHGNRTVEVPTKLNGKCQVDFVANPTAYGAVGEL